ncbi:MAG: hypothetical protein ACRDIL_01165 [Candidatus Limnocylindrales bacterium]
MTAVIVAALALVFTVASFWWIQVRRGRLVSYEPQTYSGYVMSDGFRFRLPLTIYNTGATTLVVIDLRLRFVDQDATVPVITFRRSVKPGTNDVEDFAHPLAIPGRSAVTRFVEFGSKHWVPDPDTRYRLRVEARTGDDGKWSELVRFELSSPEQETAHAYIAYRRDPADDAPAMPNV